jgi:hypothetical protein
MIIFFKITTLRARQIFYASSFKAFDRNNSYALQSFHEYLLKNFTRAE